MFLLVFWLQIVSWDVQGSRLVIIEFDNGDVYAFPILHQQPIKEGQEVPLAVPHEHILCTNTPVKECYWVMEYPIGQMIDGQFVGIVEKTYPLD